MNIYDFTHYRDAIRHWLDHISPRGGQRRLAEGAGCLPSYLSQVLAGNADLTLDQAYGMTSVMGLNAEQSDFFVLLTSRDRAASKSYREHLDRTIKQIREKKLRMSERLSPERVLSGDDLARYYAAWYYSAIHTLASIPEFQNVQAIERRLRINRDLINRAIDDLERMSLIRRSGDQITIIARDIHAESTSALNYCYHANWRTIANQRMQELPANQNVHYTAIYGLSRADAKKLKDLCYEFIQNSRNIVAPSPEETATVLSLDLFDL